MVKEKSSRGARSRDRLGRRIGSFWGDRNILCLNEGVGYMGMCNHETHPSKHLKSVYFTIPQFRKGLQTHLSDHVISCLKSSIAPQNTQNKITLLNIIYRTLLEWSPASLSIFDHSNPETLVLFLFLKYTSIFPQGFWT